MTRHLPFYPFQPPRETDYQFEIIRRSGESASDPRQFTAHRHGFIEVVWVTGQSANHLVGEGTHEVKSGQVLLIPENSAHQEYDSRYDGYAFLFTNDFFTSDQALVIARFASFNLLVPHRVIDLGPGSEVESLLVLLVGEYQAPVGLFHRQLLQALFFASLIKLEELFQQQHGIMVPVDEDGQLFHDFITLLEANFRHQHDRQFYVTALATKPKRLNAALVRLAGKTAGQLILDRLMLEAKRSLRLTDSAVKKIALELGFDDVYYFTRLFKKKNGLSPKQFRDKSAQKSS
jgi:AraC-like DNA-binding protein